MISEKTSELSRGFFNSSCCSLPVESAVSQHKTGRNGPRSSSMPTRSLTQDGLEHRDAVYIKVHFQCLRFKF